jgi:glycosyltransferase involved in cell wall biosynthesis
MMTISIIIPVYNAAPYLESSVNSVINQTYSNWELILVDDGSKDESGQICDKFAQKDSRIRVIHQENAGAGAARNNGISQTKGDYVVFVDADDYIEPHYLKQLSEHDEDVVFIDVQCVDENGQKVKEEYMSYYKDWKKDKLLRSQMTGKLPWGGVRKAVRRVILADNAIKYSNHRIGEEALYSFQVLHYAKSVGFIEGPVYSYLQHSDSLSNSKEEDPWGCVAISLRDEIKRQGDYAIYANTLNAFIETAAAVKAYKVACYNPLKESLIKLAETRAWMKEKTDCGYAIDKASESGKARVLVQLLKWHQYIVIWIISRLHK